MKARTTKVTKTPMLTIQPHQLAQAPPLLRPDGEISSKRTKRFGNAKFAWYRTKRATCCALPVKRPDRGMKLFLQVWLLVRAPPVR